MADHHPAGEAHGGCRFGEAAATESAPPPALPLVWSLSAGASSAWRCIPIHPDSCSHYRSMQSAIPFILCSPFCFVLLCRLERGWLPCCHYIASAFMISDPLSFLLTLKDGCNIQLYGEESSMQSGKEACCDQVDTFVL